MPLDPGMRVEVGDRPAVIVARKGTAERPIVRVDLAADRDAAEALRGADVTVPAEALPATEGDEYFHVDLLGCAVRSGSRELGTIHRVLAYPANDVLDVRPNAESEPLLIPFVDDVVVRVDVSERIVAIREDFL